MERLDGGEGRQIRGPDRLLTLSVVLNWFEELKARVPTP